jgi:hypothetical protein
MILYITTFNFESGTVKTLLRALADVLLF